MLHLSAVWELVEFSLCVGFYLLPWALRGYRDGVGGRLKEERDKSLEQQTHFLNISSSPGL